VFITLVQGLNALTSCKYLVKRPISGNPIDDISSTISYNKDDLFTKALVNAIGDKFKSDEKEIENLKRQK